jgi:hypothetical protein
MNQNQLRSDSSAYDMLKLTNTDTASIVTMTVIVTVTVTVTVTKKNFSCLPTAVWN